MLTKQGLLVPDPPPQPRPKHLAFLEQYPLPWHVGEEHELMATVEDHDNNLIVRLKGGNAGAVALFLCASMNALEHLQISPSWTA